MLIYSLFATRTTRSPKHSSSLPFCWQTGAGGFVIVGEADDLPPTGAMLGGSGNGNGSGAGGLGDLDMPPDFDAEPVENFEPARSAPDGAAAVGDDDMD